MAQGLKKRPQLEDLIGEGISVLAPERPYTQLGDDPRVLAYSTLGHDPATWRELEWKLHVARRFHDEVRWAAMSRGGEVGAHMAAAGLGKAPAPSGTIVGDHDSKVEQSMAADEVLRRQVIELERQRSELRKPTIAADINHFTSLSAVEQARSVASETTKAIVRGSGVAPEMLANLAGWFAANGAQDSVEAIESLTKVAQKLIDKAQQHQVEVSISPSGFLSPQAG